MLAVTAPQERQLAKITEEGAVTAPEQRMVVKHKAKNNR